MSLVKVAALFETSLQAKINGAATTMTLVSGVDKDGNTLSGLYGFVIDEGSANEEFVIGTVAGTSVTAMIRDIDVSNPDSAGTGKDHRRGASVKMTDYPFLGQIAKLLRSGGTIEPILTFLSTARPKLDTDVDTLADTEFVTKGELSRTALGALTSSRILVSGSAGETLAAGNLIYLKTSDSLWYLCDADTAATVENVVLGISQGVTTVGNPIPGGVLLRGIDTNNTVVASTIYYASNTAGGISTTPGTKEVTIGISLPSSTTQLYFLPRFNQGITEDIQDALETTASGTPLSATNTVVDEADVTTTATADRIPRALGSGLLDPSWIDLSGVIGNLVSIGTDGDVDINSGAFTSGPITSNVLTRDAYFNSLTLSGGNLNPNGFRIFVKNTTTINNGYKIFSNGGNGGDGGNGGSPTGSSGGTAGIAANTAGSLNAGVAGTVGGNGSVGATINGSNGNPGTNGVAQTVSLLSNNGASNASATSGNGGNGSYVSGATGGIGTNSAAGGSTTQASKGIKSLLEAIRFLEPANYLLGSYSLYGSSASGGSGSSGGSGGGSGSSSFKGGGAGAGGGSGAPGGIVYLATTNLVNNGQIEAIGGNGGKGGNGGNGQSDGSTNNGGGGGGGCGGSGGNGGLIYLIYSLKTGAGTTSVIAGTGGAKGTKGLKGGGATAQDGTDGMDGVAGTAGSVIELNI